MMRALHKLGLGFGLAAVLTVAAARVEAAHADSAPSADTGQARLVSEVTSPAPGSTFLVSFHLDLPAGWHTYWRFAGDSGAPPKFTWTLPSGFSAGDILYGVPSRIAVPPFMNFGFEKTADFLVPIAAPATLAAGAPVKLGLHADWLVCSLEVCIPKSGDFSLNLTAGALDASPKGDPQWSAALGRAAKELPRPAPFAVSAHVEKSQLELFAADPKLASDVKSGVVATLEFYPYVDGVIVHAAPQTVLVSANGGAVRMPAGYLFTDAKEKAPEAVNGLFVVVSKDGERTGYDISAKLGATPAGLAPVEAVPSERTGFVAAVLFAALGGMILNLMPCVFPILSMKILGFLRHGPEAKSALRRHGWLYAAGVVASFLALGAGLYALRASGAAVGWGYQLQSPVLVLLLAYLMFALALSLLGVLTIGGGFVGAGQSLAAKPGPFGDFMTGVLATLVATPCTAPFMGAALGFAFVAPPIEGLAVFLALGLGLALPYLALAHAPGVLKLLPKPGLWMERLKQVLALPMLATTAWLVWVLAKQVTPSALIAALAGFVLIAFAAWAMRPGSGARAWFARVAAVAALAVPVALLWAPAPAQPELQQDRDLGDWTPYSRARLDGAMAAGQPVFIDLTADWCLTCKVNEWSALSSARVRAAFTAAKVLRLRGDWTNRDPEITSLLAEHGRIGVPLYLFFPAGTKAAKILPQILSEDAVLRAIGG